MFAALILDRDPYTFADFPGLAQAWFQDAGGFLFIGLLFYLLISVTRPQAVPNADPRKKGVPQLTLVAAAAATILYAVYGLAMIFNFGPDLLNIKPPPDPNGYVKVVPPHFSLFGYTDGDLARHVRPAVARLDPTKPAPQPYPWQALLLSVGGLVSFVGAGAPAALGLVRLRWRRVWAIAVLCMKEVVRNWVFVSFLVVFIPLLFPINWFIPPKPENELRDAVKWLAMLASVFLVLPAVLLSAYALPNDVKNQNIFTIVTKPVERFEIVLGRFVGYVLLFTGVVAAVAVVTLLTTLASNPSPLSVQETMTARVPTRGKLSFVSRKGTTEGVDVGKEFNYRKYIAGDPTSSMRGVYAFGTIPGGIKDLKRVPLECNFDIYRLTKGEENKGVQVNLRVTTWQCEQIPPGPNDVGGEWKWVDKEAERKYKADALAEVKKLADAPSDAKANEDAAVRALAYATPDSPVWPAANEVAKKYGFFEFKGKEVYDFHPERIDLPPGLFESAAADAAGEKGEKKYNRAGPRLVAAVHCYTPSQMLGMAEGDLYLLEAEQPFWLNHLKGSVGLWCWLVLVVGLGVTLSTYLDFVVSLLSVLFLFVLAFFAGFINELGQNIGKGTNGPLTSLNQLFQAKQPTALSEGTAVEKTAETFDVGYAWAFRRVLNVLPDVDSFVWTKYVAEGFNIPGECLVMNVVVLAAYLFPWFLLSYYLIRGREVAA